MPDGKIILQNLGLTRSSVQRNHALLTPESFERITQPAWPDADVIYLVSPQMGAGFSMAMVECHGGTATLSAGLARFLFVLEGAVKLHGDSGEHLLEAEDYVFLPPTAHASLHYPENSRLIFHEWRYLAYRSGTPATYSGKSAAVQSFPLKGDPGLQVQKLLPAVPQFDCEFNLMTFSPGATLPYVETHFMEHGLLFLDGGGIYRLDESWYPVQRGDAIWMGPHVPQWFGALGKSPSRYLIYKNYNRPPIP